MVSDSIFVLRIVTPLSEQSGQKQGVERYTFATVVCQIGG